MQKQQQIISNEFLPVMPELTSEPIWWHCLSPLPPTLAFVHAF